jgi:uncharacterized protein (DUF983 family)
MNSIQTKGIALINGASAGIGGPIEQRDGWTSLTRGFHGRCPNCGKGKLFRAFLKVADYCPVCQEPLHHHRADDAPAYFVILIVGHIVVPVSLLVETEYPLPLWVHALIWIPLTLAMSLALLQPIKGAIVAWQWAHRMHGFNPSDSDDPVTPQRAPERP